MPIYPFIIRSSGEYIEKMMSVKELTAIRRADGGFDIPEGAADQDYGMKINGNSHMATCWPMKCDASGVHPSQVGVAEEDAKKAGINLRFDPRTGQAIYESRGQRAAYLKHRGLHDKSGGYAETH